MQRGGKMMNPNKPVFLMCVLLTGFILVLTWNSKAFAPEDWQELPPLTLQDCIQVDKVLARNPLSQTENDFWMVLKYEEKQKGSPIADLAEGPAEQNIRSLSMYLVTGVAVLAEEDVGVPYYRFLIVSFTQEGPTSETTQQWLLTDTNNDGKLDKARFEKIVKNARGQTTDLGEIEIPKEQIQRFQDFYEKASKELSSKAEEDVSKQCLVS